jgi:hypothetical protein
MLKNVHVTLMDMGGETITINSCELLLDKFQFFAISNRKRIPNDRDVLKL